LSQYFEKLPATLARKYNPMTLTRAARKKTESVNRMTGASATAAPMTVKHRKMPLYTFSAVGLSPKR